MKPVAPISILSKAFSRFIFSRKARAPHVQSPKVLMLTQYLLLGGLERMIFNLATSLKGDLNLQPSVFVFDHAKQTETSTHLGNLFEAEKIPVVYYSKTKGFSFKAVLKIVETLLLEDIDVIHSHDLGALIYGACAKLCSLGSVRLIHTQHSFVHLGRKKRYEFYEKFFARIADEIAVVSPDTGETYLRLGIAKRKIHFIPNGVRFAVNSEEIGPLSKDERRCARQKAIASATETQAALSLAAQVESHWILYMARIHGRKGQDQAMKLWSALSKEVRRKAVLLFVGLETESGQLALLHKNRESAPDKDRVLYLGPSLDPAVWLRASEIFLSCSEFEGMPLASIEAAGSGLALVLSSIAGHEVLKPESAQYPLENPKMGARAIESVVDAIESDENVYFRQIWDRTKPIRAKYSVSEMARAYSKLYT
jgi:glycosyltransferase involved in cell wall biosynthesis